MLIVAFDCPFYGLTAGLAPAAVLDLPNGLTAEERRHIPAPDTRLLPAAARPGFMLAMARAVPYKGFDDLLDALTLLQTRGVPYPHVLVAAVTDEPTLSPYQQHLARQIHDRKLNATPPAPLRPRPAEPAHPPGARRRHRALTRRAVRAHPVGSIRRRRRPHRRHHGRGPRPARSPSRRSSRP